MPAQDENGEGRAEVGLEEDQAADDAQDDRHGDQAEGEGVEHIALGVQPERTGK